MYRRAHPLRHYAEKFILEEWIIFKMKLKFSAIWRGKRIKITLESLDNKLLSCFLFTYYRQNLLIKLDLKFIYSTPTTQKEQLIQASAV